MTMTDERMQELVRAMVRATEPPAPSALVQLKTRVRDVSGTANSGTATIIPFPRKRSGPRRVVDVELFEENMRDEMRRRGMSEWQIESQMRRLDELANAAAKALAAARDMG